MSRQCNILWIFSDQQPAYTLSCNGDPNSHTPNLDRLTGSGFNFRNAVSGYPLCCPFRGSLLTGEYPHCCVPGHEYRLPPETPTAANYFNADGYNTAYIGKWHWDDMKEVYPINHIDILPTALGLAGIDAPKKLPGFDYSALLCGKQLVASPESAYLQNVNPTMHVDSIDRAYRGVVTRDGWKYVRTEEGDWQLFDLNSNPYEECNLAFNSKFREKRGKLRQMTAAWIVHTGDAFHFPYQSEAGIAES